MRRAGIQYISQSFLKELASEVVGKVARQVLEAFPASPAIIPDWAFLVFVLF
jgi:hypothetical protein